MTDDLTNQDACGSAGGAGATGRPSLDPAVFTAAGLYRFLEDAIADGGAGTREQVANIARYGDEGELIYPAYVALLTWGEVGFQTIVEIASRGTTVKVKSAALTLLSAVAISGQLPPMVWPMIFSDFRERVNRRLDAPTAKGLGRQFLRQLILSTETDDLLQPVAMAFMQLSTQTPADPAAGQQLVSALSSKWFQLGPKALEAFEGLLSTHADDEPTFQQFFSHYPQLLDPMAAQVWSQPALHGAFIPDFLVRRADDSYLVVEIETPGKRIVTRTGQLGRAALVAEKQVFDYRRFLDERVGESKRHFPGFSRAEGLVVIGREDRLTDSQVVGLRMANEARQNLRIVGFDWLLRRAQAVTNNISEGQISVVQGYRVV
jgi:hypothetical protein